MSALEPTLVTKEQLDQIQKIEALPRSERRRLGKMWHTKIPGSNKPEMKS